DSTISAISPGRSGITSCLQSRARSKRPASPAYFVRGSEKSLRHPLTSCAALKNPCSQCTSVGIRRWGFFCQTFFGLRRFAGQVLQEEAEHTVVVFAVGDVDGLVVLGGFDEPEFLGAADAVEEGAGHVGLDVGVAAAVDHEDGAVAEAADGVFEVGEAA